MNERKLSEDDLMVLVEYFELLIQMERKQQAKELSTRYPSDASESIGDVL